MNRLYSWEEEVADTNAASCQLESMLPSRLAAGSFTN